MCSKKLPAISFAYDYEQMYTVIRSRTSISNCHMFSRPQKSAWIRMWAISNY